MPGFQSAKDRDSLEDLTARISVKAMVMTQANHPILKILCLISSLSATVSDNFYTGIG